MVLVPLITEKSLADAKKNTYTFTVEKTADKDIIRKMVKKQFNVDPVAVSTTIVKGRGKRVGKRRTEKLMTAWKKVLVRVKEGQKIDAFVVEG